jgi:uncharacterized protein YjbJ (UPF0337 family)
MSAAEAARVLEEEKKIIDITPEEVPVGQQLPVIKQKADEVAVFAFNRIVVVDNETMTQADAAVARADKALTKIEEDWGQFRDAAHKAHKGWTTLIGKLTNPVKAYKDYHVDQVKKYKRQLADAEAAERRRIEEEAKKKAEEEALAEAERLEKEGYVEEAEAVISEPVHYTAPKFTSSAPKVDNRKYRTIWKAEVQDKAAFILFVADMLRKIPELKKAGRHAEAQVYAEYAQALDVSQSWVNRKAAAQGKEFCMAGLRAFEA